MKKLTFSIENMKCEGCVNAIESALAALDGVNEANVSLESHQAIVESSLASSDIEKAISEAGFPAKVV